MYLATQDSKVTVPEVPIDTPQVAALDKWQVDKKQHVCIHGATAATSHMTLN